ncbi:glucose-6-phosphate dehydrogenase assembly protein OpcA [Micrococcales bacterium 31B]|nr:glucose-6-phosphate dehydrogenase assembly protein OpcA [Micrococcales bacterium 31B]
MIKLLPDTTTAQVNRELVKLRDAGGVVALGRVMTLVIVTTPELAESSIRAANKASREHPCRVIVLVTGSAAESRLDAEIRVGGDAGASEVIVFKTSGEAAQDIDTLITPLLLPDAPIVTWWTDYSPDSLAADPLGKISQRRIIDTARCSNPVEKLRSMRDNHTPRDTDMSWTRLTSWRGVLATTLDQPPYEPVTRAIVRGITGAPQAALLAAWLRARLGVEVVFEEHDAIRAIYEIELVRPSGSIVLHRPDAHTAVLSTPGQPDQLLSMPHRKLYECLAEELRRLDPDEIYAEVLHKGFDYTVVPAEAAS